MAILLDDNSYVFEKMCYDKGENICKPLEPVQKIGIELSIADMHDSDAVRDAIKNLGYERKSFDLTLDQHIRMVFEKKPKE